MKTSLILLSLSLVALAVGLVTPGWSDLLLLAAPSAFASLWLLLRARRSHQGASKTGKKKRKRQQNWVIIDGSNVMYWKGGKPDLSPLHDVLERLEGHGLTAGVMFDANAGYLLNGKYQHDHAFGAILGLPEERIMVVPKGTPADPYILTAARDFKARIVTNDQFRDWEQQFPEVTRDGFLIKGIYRKGDLFLTL